MDYTFADNDRVFVNKFSKTFERGDEVVFHANETDDYIKRIIGVPGDTIEYKNCLLYTSSFLATIPSYLSASIAKKIKTVPQI